MYVYLTNANVCVSDKRQCLRRLSDKPGKRQNLYRPIVQTPVQVPLTDASMRHLSSIVLNTRFLRPVTGLVGGSRRGTSDGLGKSVPDSWGLTRHIVPLS